MNIELEKDILLLSDEMQFILKKKIGINKKTRKPTYRTLGYYTTLEQALNGYLKYRTRLSEAKTLNEVLVEIENIKDDIKKLIGGN